MDRDVALAMEDGASFQSLAASIQKLTGKGGVLSSLNQRLFIIIRLRNSLNDEGLRKVTESLFTSKLRHGLQLFGQVRWSEEDPSPLLMAQLQKSQNKLQIENK